jgi:hypothetical protein
MKKADIALCRIEFPEYVPPDMQITNRFWLDTAPVKVGDSVRAFGYSNMNVPLVEPGENIKSFKANWLVETGIVKEVYPTRGPTGQEHPCFQISSTLVGGMSGGPVITIGEDDTPCVRGVVRSDETRAADPESEEPPPTAIASMLWPVMLMPWVGPDQYGKVSDLKLIELERGELIQDKGKASRHVKFRMGENGQVTEAEWQHGEV